MLAFFTLGMAVPGAAQTQIDRLTQALHEENNDSIRIKIQIDLSRKIHEKKHDEEKEYRYAQAAIEKALFIKNKLLYAIALDNLGLLYRYHKHYSEAITLHTKAFALVDSLPNQAVQEMIFANNAGLAYRYNENYAQAVFYYLKALRIAEANNDLRNIAISCNGLGNTFANIPGKEDEALQYFERSLAAEEERGNSLGVAMNYLSISDYYTLKKQYAKSRNYLDKLLLINQKRGDRHGLAITYEFYGHNYLQEGVDLEKADSYFEQSFQQFEELGDLRKQADVLANRGDVNHKQGKDEPALRYYLRSMALGKKTGNKGIMLRTSKKLSEIYESWSDSAKALYFFKLAQEYKDSIDIVDQEIQIAALSKKYDIEQKESQIELLEKDNTLRLAELSAQREKLKNRGISILFLLTGFIAIIIISFMQYRNISMKRKATLLLAEEEKKKLNAIYEKELAQAEMLATRLQMNPHFLFNCLNSIKYLIQVNQHKEAVKYLVTFSRFVRIILETSKKHAIPLDEELSLIRYYLILEASRFDDRFSFNIITDPNDQLDDILLPPLLLQPFVENAIWHGLLPSEKEDKTLDIIVSRHQYTVDIFINDNGIGRQKAKENTHKPHTSMGTQITMDRIHLFNDNYPAFISCEIIDRTSEDGIPNGTSVSIKIINESP